MRSPIIAISLTLALAVSSSTFADEVSEEEPMSPELAERLAAIEDDLAYQLFAQRLEAELHEHALALVSSKTAQLIRDIEFQNALALANPHGEILYESASSMWRGPGYVITVRDELPGCGAAGGSAPCASAPETAQPSFAASPAPR